MKCIFLSVAWVMLMITEKLIKIHCTVKKNDVMYCNFEKKKLAFKGTYIDKKLAK